MTCHSKNTWSKLLPDVRKTPTKSEHSEHMACRVRTSGVWQTRPLFRGLPMLLGHGGVWKAWGHWGALVTFFSFLCCSILSVKHLYPTHIPSLLYSSFSFVLQFSILILSILSHTYTHLLNWSIVKVKQRLSLCYTMANWKTGHPPQTRLLLLLFITWSMRCLFNLVG